MLLRIHFCLLEYETLHWMSVVLKNNLNNNNSPGRRILWPLQCFSALIQRSPSTPAMYSCLVLSRNKDVLTFLANTSSLPLPSYAISAFSWLWEVTFKFKKQINSKYLLLSISKWLIEATGVRMMLGRKLQGILCMASLCTCACSWPVSPSWLGALNS